MSNLPESYSKSVRSDNQDRVREERIDPTFEEALQRIINQYSKENGSNTPDFLLARYLNNCLLVFNSMIQAREAWYGRDSHPDESKDLTQLLSPSLKTDQDKGGEDE